MQLVLKTVSKFHVCERKLQNMVRVSLGGSETKGQRKESQGFACRHIISKINTSSFPLCLSSCSCLLSAEHFRFS